MSLILTAYHFLLSTKKHLDIIIEMAVAVEIKPQYLKTLLDSC